MPSEWNLHYSRWVIDDGQPERHVGDVFNWFAISLWADAALMKIAEKSKFAVPMADNVYRVGAEIVYTSQEASNAACVLDFGIKAVLDFGDVLPLDCRQGDYVSGAIRFELPLCTKLHPHNLKQRWRVNRISADLTPYVRRISGGFVRDSSQVRYQDVLGTDIVHAESYVLHCSEVGGLE